MQNPMYDHGFSFFRSYEELNLNLMTVTQAKAWHSRLAWLNL
jgi:hypothetical protein